MLRKVFTSLLAMMLILGVAIPLHAAPELVPLAPSDEEARVIVQLEQNPVLIYETQLKERGTFTTQGVDSYARTLERNLKSLIELAESKVKSLKTEAQYTHCFYGFSASLPFSQIAELEKLPGVKKVFPDLPVEIPEFPVQPLIDYTVPQTGAPYLWNMPGGYTGEGMIVAVIDTGIDYTHPYLWDWPEDADDPTCRVIGFRNFTTDRTPDDPMDGHGHGTHVAGIVAADGADWDDPEFKGMAPDAWLYAIKVLSDAGRGSSSWVISGIEWAVNPEVGLPRADVINMSLGASGVTTPGYPTCLAANAAVDAGVIVAASAGNDGQESPTVSAPGTAAKVISVASYGYIHKAYINIDGEVVWDVAPAADAPAPDAMAHGIVYAGLGGEEDFTGLDLTGKIALMQRGTYAFTEKAENAAAAGAVAALIFNNTTGIQGMAGTFTIPAFAISQATGLQIIELLKDDPDLQVIMAALPPQDLISDFSSAGPVTDYSLKPDITAPGDAVESLYPAAGGYFATMGGTSMACPHVAGAAALLKHMYGDTLTIEEYKALLMNTAASLSDLDGDIYPVTTIGSGTMDLRAAALSRGLVLPGSMSLRRDGESHDMVVRNLSDEEVTYNITFASDTLEATYPATITVPAGQTRIAHIDFTNMAGLADGHHEGTVVFTPTVPMNVEDDEYYDILHIPVYHFVGSEATFFVTDFESPEEVYPWEEFEVSFSLIRHIDYVQLGIYDLAGNFWGGWVIAEAGIGPGSYPLTGLNFEGDLPEGDYVLELYGDYGPIDDPIFSLCHNQITVKALLEVTSPDDGTFVNTDSIEVAGSVTTACTLRFWVGEDYSDVVVSAGSFSYELNIEEGVNNLAVTAGKIIDDEYVLLDVAVFDVIKDSIAPEVTIETPTDNLVTSSKEVTVSGFVSDENLAEVRVNEAVVDLSDEGAFSASVSLSAGKNTITVKATDLAGNTTVETVTVRLAVPIIIPPVIEPEAPVSTRLAGANRYATSVAVSQEGWETSEYVVLARGDNYADALAGATLAFSLDAPILLTESSRLTAVTKAEIQRLEASQVIILGGLGAISQETEDALEEMDLEVERITGSNRFETAALVAAKVAPSGTAKAVLVSGSDFPDALSVAAYAARAGLPILLTEAGKLPDVTSKALKDLGVSETVVVGGLKAIGDAVLASVPGGTRISGSNRYATSVAVAEFFQPDSTLVYIATGLSYADALSGAVLAAKNNSGILLVGNELPQEIADYLKGKGFSRVIIFGGTGAIPAELENALKDLLK